MDAKYISGSFVVTGSMIYGTTPNGGTSNMGTVFKMGIDGSNFVLLHNFAGSDEHRPNGDVVVSGGLLYAMANAGGASGSGCGGSGCGTAFSIGLDGTGFTNLLNFMAGTADGQYPVGNLLLLGDTLYGTSLTGGANNFGTIYNIKIVGSSFGLLHSFSNSSSDGQYPCSTLTFVKDTFYGMSAGNNAASFGTLFKFVP